MGCSDEKVRRAHPFALVLLLAVAVITLTAYPAQEAEAAASEDAAFGRGELIVGFDDAGAGGAATSEAASSIEQAGYEVERILAEGTDRMGTIVLVAAAADDADAETLALMPGISYVQPNYRYSASSTAAVSMVSDGEAAIQYYLDGYNRHGANVAAAWGEAGQGARVSVAVLDTGVYTMGTEDPAGFHQEFDGANLEISLGRDFVNSDSPGAPLPLVNESNPQGDDNGHGTHVSAIIAALSSLSPSGQPLGMAGVCPNATIIPLKVLDADGEGDTAGFVGAYAYLMSIADEANLRVINMSFSLTEASGDESDEELDDGEPIARDGNATIRVHENDDGGYVDDEALAAVIREAADRGIITVCAAGNEGLTGETFPGDLEDCLCVEALDAQGGNAGFSNYNADKDISAPGEDIYSAWATQADAYRYISGTSQSTAIVSGVFALLWSAEPGLSVDEAKAAVYATAHAVTGGTQRISPGEDGVCSGSHGAIDAAAALAFARGEVKSIADGARCQVAAIEDQEFKDGPVTPAVSVTYDGAELVQGTDYTVSYLNNTEMGEKTAVALVQGAGGYTGWVPARFSIVEGEGSGGGDEGEGGGSGGGLTTGIDLASAKLALSKTSYVYTGSPRKPAVKVTFKSGGTIKTLVQGTDYKVSYSDSTGPGSAKVTVSGKGTYTGQKSAKYTISLGTTKVKSLKAGKKKAVVSWSRQKYGSVGYQVRYCLKKGMKGATVKTVRKNATTKLTLKGLKSGKRYYVQVRTYKKVGGTVHYSGWSAKKSVKVN